MQTSNTGRYLYHKMPSQLEGHELFPVNMLKEKLPEIWTMHEQANKGKVVVHETIIPHVNCNWLDLLHCPTINPKILYKKLKELGHDLNDDLHWFKIPVEMLSNKEACIFEGGGQVEDKDSFSPFFLETYEELQEIPEITLSYYEKCKENGKKPLTFVGIPHVLIHGKLDVKQLNIIRWSDK